MKRRAVALAAGVICHLSFLVGSSAMIVGLATGLCHARGSARGLAAHASNLLLLVQFPLLHSFLLSRCGRNLLALVAPGRLGQDLVSTTFATIASWQVGLVFLLWSPSGVVLWRPMGTSSFVLALIPYGFAWLLVIKSMMDAGLALQTGALGWWSVWHGRRPSYGPLPTRGLFSFCRQPLYLSFLLMLWLGPVWTWDHLEIALGWTAYCVLGPRLKERRLERWHGAAYRQYQERVPYLVPRWPRRRLEDA